MHRIKTDFHYDKTATTVTSTVADVMDKRGGRLPGLRAPRAGVPAQPRHGGPVRERLPRDAAAARQAAARRSRRVARVGRRLDPGSDQWLAFDPTNDQWASDRHVTVAWGRDYGDVPPVKGVIFTEAKKSTLRVSVDVAPLEEYSQG